MRRKLAAFILLAGFTLAVPALAETGAGAPLPAEQSANEKALVANVQAAVGAKQWPDAEAALKQLVSFAPRWNYYEALGDAQYQYNEGRYADSIASYERAIDLAQNKALPDAIGRIFTMVGNGNLKLKYNEAAVAAFTKAAELDPNPAVAYFSLCATMYNIGQTGAKTIAICDKAITADPKKADAYFINGSALFGNATIGKDKKPTFPSGTAEALKQYLVLAPDGPHAEDVKQMINFLK